jgi:hypothetical protein
MLLIREIMYCKPGKVRPLVEKFLTMSRLMEQAGMAKTRVMTDVAAERYWTLVAEFEVPSLQAFEEMMAPPAAGQAAGGPNAEVMKQMDEVMKGYHKLVERGKREIYRIEG